MNSKTPSKAYAVAVLREDMGLKFCQIGERMDCSPAAARYLYKQFTTAEKKGKNLLHLWTTKPKI